MVIQHFLNSLRRAQGAQIPQYMPLNSVRARAGGCSTLTDIIIDFSVKPCPNEEIKITLYSVKPN